MNWSKQKKIIILVLAATMLLIYSPVLAQEAAPGNIAPPAQTQPSSPDEFGDDEPAETTQKTAGANQPDNKTPSRINSLYGQISQLTCIGPTVLGACVSRLLAWIMFWILVMVMALFQVFGMLFDLATAVTLDPATYNLEPIRAGWAIARDTANLFFIFVLLTMAIATILQIETYSAKKLLPNLVFGAPSGSASNSLSVKFLAGVNPNRMLASANLGNTFGEIEKVQNRLQEVQRELSEEDVTAEQQISLSADQKELSNKLKTLSNSKDLLNTTFQLSIAMFGTAVFILFAMFALAVAGISLLIRVVMLWFLMILSPIAFLFFVIPGLSGEAKKWWDTLLKQAFFAPGFFFLFGLTVEMIAGGSAQALFGADQQYQGAFITSFTIIGYYVLLIIMLMASVAFAKAFGSYSGQWAEKGAKALRGYALGYAGKMAGRTAGVAGRIARRSIAPLAEDIQKCEGWFAKTIKAVPFATRGIARVAAAGRSDVKEMEKKYDKYSNTELKNLMGQAGTPMDSQTAIGNILASRKDLKPDGNGKMTSDDIKRVSKHASDIGMGKEAKTMRDLMYQYAETDEDWQEVGKKLNPAQIPDLSSSFFENDKAMNSLIGHGSIKHIEKVIDARSNEETAKFFGLLTQEAGGNDIAQITAYLNDTNRGNNPKLAQQLQDPGFYKTVISAHINYPPAAPAGGRGQPAAGGGQQPGGQPQQPYRGPVIPFGGAQPPGAGQPQTTPPTPPTPPNPPEPPPLMPPFGP